MHTPKRSPLTAGFTLVELLTVIAIIAILMGILFPTIGSAIESAKKTQAKNDCLQIVNAVKAYYTEYGKYPDINTSGIITSSSDNKRLMDILRAKETSNPLQNPRKIVFLEVTDAKNFGIAAKERAGMAKTGEYLDPWGGTRNFYYLSYDADYDNALANPYSANAGTPGTPPSGGLSVGVIAWSVGRDAKGGTGDKNGTDSKDDVISWQ